MCCNTHKITAPSTQPTLATPIPRQRLNNRRAAREFTMCIQMDSFSSQPGGKASIRPSSSGCPWRLSLILYILSSSSYSVLSRTWCRFNQTTGSVGYLRVGDKDRPWLWKENRGIFSYVVLLRNSKSLPFRSVCKPEGGIVHATQSGSRT